MKKELQNIKNLHVLGNNEKCTIKGGKKDPKGIDPRNNGQG